VQFVERVEEGLLRLGLADHELDVLYYQEISVSELGAKLLGAPLLEGVHELIGKLLAAGTKDPEAILRGIVGYGVSKVCLSYSGYAVDEQWVVFASWSLSRCHGGSEGQAVRGSDDEGVKGVPRIDHGQKSRGGGVPGKGTGISTKTDLELDLNLLPRDADEDLGHERTEALLQPLLGEGAGSPDNKLASLLAEANGIFEPSIEVGFAYLNLKGALGGLPGLFGCPHPPPFRDLESAVPRYQG